MIQTDSHDKSQLLFHLFWISLVSVVIFGFIDFYSAPGVPIYETFYMGISSLLGLLLLWKAPKIQTELIAEFVGYSAVLGMLYKCFLSEGHQSYSVFWLFVVPFLLFTISTRRAAYLSAIVVALAYSYMSFFDQYKGLRESPSWVYSLSFVSAIAVCMFVLFRYEKNINNLLSELMQKQKALEKAIDELNETKKTVEVQLEENKQLIRLLSHDIKNPVSIIRGSLGQIENMSEELKFKKSIDKIDKASNQIDEIVNNIRDMQAVRSGKMTLDLMPVDLKSVFAELAKSFEDRIAAKQLKLTFDLSVADLSVLAEKISLTHQVLANLISNAIKFSPVGGWIAVSAGASGPNKVTLIVEDQGIGMPEDLVKNIFDPHVKTSRKGTMGEKGTGFGMPLVKAFIEKMNGQIELMSKEAPEGLSSEEVVQSGSGTKIFIVLERAVEGES